MRIGMTLSGHDPEPHSTEVCRPGAYVSMLDWIDTLPPGEFPAVEEFAKTDRYKPTSELATQLNDAANKHNPPKGGAQTAVVALLDRIGLGWDDETITIED